MFDPRVDAADLNENLSNCDCFSCPVPNPNPDSKNLFNYDCFSCHVPNPNPDNNNLFNCAWFLRCSKSGADAITNTDFQRLDM